MLAGDAGGAAVASFVVWRREGRGGRRKAEVLNPSAGILSFDGLLFIAF